MHGNTCFYSSCWPSKSNSTAENSTVSITLFIFLALPVQIWKKCIFIVLTLLPNHSLKPKSGLLARERMVNLKITIFGKVPENISTSSRAASRTAEVNCFFFLGAGRSLAKLARGSLTTKLFIQSIIKYMLMPLFWCPQSTQKQQK